MNTYNKSTIIALAIFTTTVFAFDKDINATQDELTQYNEKYLKGKLHPNGDSNISNIIRLSDLAKTKDDVNLTLQKLNTQKNNELFFEEKKSNEANNIDTLVRDKTFINKVKDNKKYILENYNIGGKKMESSKELNNTLSKEVDTNTINGKENIFIVISSSIPKEQIREYFKAVEGKENISFVLRGLIGDPQKFEPTRQYLEEITRKNPEDKGSREVYNIAININPKITTKYKIDKVPAVIYVKNYNGQIEKSEPLENNSSEEFWISYGMASLEYIIEQINKEAKSKWLEGLLRKDTFFNQKDK